MNAEILAPAGSFDALIAAVRCGANAVYLGGKTLNARRNASNFSDEELKKAVDYCHKRNVKVYITLNTLVSDGELETAYEAIKRACDLSADALILQDTGVAALAKSVAPSMPLHASTQMSVQSIEGIRVLEKLGFSRAVLPRELSEKEIDEVQRMIDRFLLAAGIVVAVNMKRQTRHCFREDSDAGVDRRHLHGCAFRHGFTGGRATQEKAVCASGGSVLRLVPGTEQPG